MEVFDPHWELEESFARFERAAAKGHEESMSIHVDLQCGERR
jgi:hypothetical protein